MMSGAFSTNLRKKRSHGDSKTDQSNINKFDKLLFLTSKFNFVHVITHIKKLIDNSLKE